MNKNEEIKKRLLEASKEIDELILEQGNVRSYLKLGFLSPTGMMVKVAYAMAVLLTLLLVCAGYQFYLSSPSSELFWGVCLLLSFNAQVATKLWIFSQSNKNFLAKEIRLMELRLAERMRNGETHGE